MTEQTKKEIAALYADRSNRTHDIAAAYKISPAKLTQLILEMGMQPRCPAKLGSRGVKSKIKKCPKCRKLIEIKGARFCPFCATDIRSESEVLKERATWLWQIVGVIGQNDRDKARDIINDIIAYLDKQGITK